MTETDESIIVFRVLFFLLVRGFEKYRASGKVRNRRGNVFLVVVLSTIFLELIKTAEVIFVPVVSQFASVLVDPSYSITTQISNAPHAFNSPRNQDM